MTANLTFDEAMLEIVLPSNPLRGPIMMDYLNHGDFRVGLVDQSYEDDTDHFWRMDNMSRSINSFWRIVRTWVTPTCDDMYTWIRDLCKHIIVMHELFETGLGVMGRPDILMDTLELMTGFVEGFNPLTAAQEYKTVLEQENVRTALVYLLSLVRVGKNRVDIRDCNTEFITVLYKQICGTVKNVLIPWQRQQKVDMPERERSEGYQRRLYTEQGNVPNSGPEGSDFLQFPGCIYNKGLEQPNDSLVKLPESAFQEPSESLSANQASIDTALMFYSNVDNRLRGEFNNVVAAYVDGATSYTGEPIHNNHGQWNTYLQRSDHQQMERVNYKALRRLFAGTWEQVKLAPDKEEDVAMVESAGIPGIAALQAGIKAKSGTKTKADATKKEKTSNNTVFLLLAAGAAVAYAAS